MTLALFLPLPQHQELFLLIVRWLHFLAGILWIGMLFFFVLVATPFFRELDAETKPRIYRRLMMPALNWFRWAALVTVLSGLAYWGEIVAGDARNAVAAGFDGASSGPAMGSFFGLWTAVWLFFYLVMKYTKNASVSILAICLATIGAARLYLHLNNHGWESNRLLAIGIGGGIGWVLMLNVWGIVWRVQKRIMRWMEDFAQNGTPIPAEAGPLALQAQITARASFILVIPLLLFMAVASHFPVFGR
jgi:uncharacterized membrane protein